MHLSKPKSTLLSSLVLVGAALIACASIAISANSTNGPSKPQEKASAISSHRGGSAEAPDAKPHEAEHGLSQYAVEVGRVFGFTITNSIVVTWVVAAGLILFAQVATRRMQRIPEGAQNFW